MKKYIILHLLLICSCTAFCQDYFLGASKDRITEYYIMSVTVNKRTNTMEVFDRIKPAAGQLAAFRKQMIENREKDKLNTDGFEKLGYYRRKIQYSCRLKKYRQMECTYYDLNGKVIDETEPDEKTKWEPIPPATIREAEFKKVCNL